MADNAQSVLRRLRELRDNPRGGLVRGPDFFDNLDAFLRR